MTYGYPKDASHIHLFEINDRRLAYDVCSSVFFNIDELAWDILEESCKCNSEEELATALAGKHGGDSVSRGLAELERLEKKGTLFSPDMMRSKQSAAYPLSALCLNVSHDCNLRCIYCFAEAGSYGGSHRRKMSVEVARSAVDFFIKDSGNQNDLSLSFFGGEPMMNFRVIKETVAYADAQAESRGKQFVYGITTNGTILDGEKIDYLNQHDFSIIVSMDGTKEIHDTQRPFIGSRCSYDQVRRNLDNLIASRPGQRGISIRGTFTRRMPNLTDMVMDMVCQGYMDISVEPAYTKVKGLEWQEEDLKPVKAEYTNLATQYLREIKNGNVFSFFHFKAMMDYTDERLQHITQCGAGTGYLAIAADGALYPCHKLVGRERYKLGNVVSGVIHRDIQEQFRQAHVNNKEKCRSCWARYICGGGCNAYNSEFNDSILEPYEINCQLMRHRIELGAYLYSELTPAERKTLGYASGRVCCTRPNSFT